MKKKAVILVSGGLDSVTVVAIAKSQDYEIFPISFNYSQRHNVELTKAKKSLEHQDISNHKIINIDLGQFGGSALTDKNIDVPTYQKSSDIGDIIPVTYVPARNTIFLSLALAYAETIGAFDIFIGAHVQDSANYPDCREEYIKSYENMANKAIGATNDGKNKINIHAPLIKMTKAEIIQAGLHLGVDYSNTISCYNATPEGLSCGKCIACLVRIAGFKENGLEDPVPYIKN
jgi:7-cyano-7-deazaguanine synthase